MVEVLANFPEAALEKEFWDELAEQMALPRGERPAPDLDNWKLSDLEIAKKNNPTANPS